MEEIARGLPAGGGIYSGHVRIVNTLEELDELQDGEVLVVVKSSPAWTIGLLKAGAIVSETGGVISHAAIVAREMSIPCVVGVPEATRLLRNGMNVLVNGDSGSLFAVPDVDATEGK